jgi:hypothetical protein
MKVNNDKAAGWIAGKILSMQQKFAKVCGKLSERWKRKQQLIFIYTISIVLGGLSVLAILQPFNARKPGLTRPAGIKFIKSIPEDRKAKITEEEVKKVKDFLDTAKYIRPGLKDSLEKVIQKL